MEQKIQSKLIQWVLQPIASFMTRFSERTKDILFICAGLMIFFTYFLFSAGSLTAVRFLYRYAFDCLMFGLMILSIMPAEVRPIRFDKALFVPWCIVVLFMLIAGITKSEDYLPNAMLMMVAYPVFYIVAVDFRRILHLLFHTVRISFCIFLLVNILFFPIMQRRYSGFFNNVNGVSFYLILVFCCCLFDLLASEKIGLFYLLNLAIMGISAALIYYTSSRTGWFTVALVLFFTMCLFIFTDRRTFFKTFSRYFLPILLSVAVCIPSTLYIFRIPTIVSQVALKPNPEDQQPNPEDQQPNPEDQQPNPEDQQPNPEDQQPNPEDQQPDSPSVSEVMTDIQTFHANRFSLDGKTLYQITSGRNAIWAEYVKHLSFWGHDNQEQFYIAEKKSTNSSAHMTILEYAYSYGVPAGLAYLAFNLIAGVKSVRYALRRPKDRYALVPCVVSIAFGFVSLFASLVTSFNCMLTFYYYLVQCPLVPKMEKLDK